MDQKLLDYVVSQLRSGTLPDDIKKSLLKEGWQEQLVDEALRQMDSSASALSNPTSFQNSSPPPSTSFFKRKIFKFFVLPLGIFVLVLIALEVVTGGFLGFLARFGYHYVQESFNNSSNSPVVANFTTTTSPPYAHVTSLADLGITIASTTGNGAYDFMGYFDVFHNGINHEGEYARKYKNVDEGTINLDVSDEKVLSHLASKITFSFHPEVYSLPQKPLESWKALPNPGQIMRYVRRMIVKSGDVEKSGDRSKAEKMLKELIVWGRKMEETKNNYGIQWLVGEKIEEYAVDAFVSFYDRNGMMEQSKKFKAYRQELEDMKKQKQAFLIKVSDFTVISVTLLGLHPAQSSNRTFIRAAYDQMKTSEAEFLALLNSFNTDDIAIQDEAITGLMNLTLQEELQPEQSIALKILQKYEQSSSDAVRNMATYVLTNSSTTIINHIRTLQ